MDTEALTFLATRRLRAAANFFASRTSVPVEFASSNDESDAGLRCTDRVHPVSDVVSPIDLRERLVTAGIATPEFRIVDSADEVESAFRGNQSVTVRAGAESQFAQFAADAVLPYHRLTVRQLETSAVVEVPPVGSGHWVMGISSADGVHVRSIVDIEWKDDFRRFPVAVSAPTELSTGDAALLSQLSLQVADVMKLSHGPFRVECVKTDRGFVVTEVDLGWFGGGLPVDLLQIAGLADYWGEQCALLGIPCEPATLEPRAATLRWLRSRSGIVESVNGVNDVLALPGVQMLQVDVEVGETLGHVVDRHTRDRLGYLVVTEDSPHRAQTLSTYAVESVVVHRRTMIEA